MRLTSPDKVLFPGERVTKKDLAEYYAEIGPATILSRAVGGLMGERVILVMPGSRAAVQLAMSKIILPELPHIVREARKGLPG